MKSVGVFANVSNQFGSVLSAFRGSKIDYGKYLQRAVGNESLYRAFAYGVQIADEAAPFIICLNKVGFETRYKQARNIRGRPSIRETDWNVGIAMDVVRHIDRLDTVVIGSNDPDLAPLIDYIKERGRKAVIFSCKISNELRSSADLCLEIDESVLESKTPIADAS